MTSVRQIFNCGHQHGPFTQPSFCGKYIVLVHSSLRSLNVKAEVCSFKVCNCCYYIIISLFSYGDLILAIADKIPIICWTVY